MSLSSRGWAWLVGALTLLSVFVTLRWVRPTGDVATLLPNEGDARALLLRERLFGANEPGLVLLEASDPDEVARAARTLGALVPSAVTGLEPAPLGAPTSWMLLADEEALTEIGALLSPEGMRARVHETRALLLAPGGGALAATLARDPLRVAELVGTRVAGRSALRSPDGTARLVVVPTDARVFTSGDAAAAADALTKASREVTAAHPSVDVRVAGAHLVASETEARIRRDVFLSSTLSLALSALVFLAVSRNARLLVTVIPPVLAGTVMTAALVPLAGGKLSGIAAAFVSVVVGVGMDTGVHAHLAVIDATREKHPNPVAHALSVVARPTLTAAVAAGAAFACLGVSSVPALRQLGLLAAAGEVLTALAVLAWTPRLAAWCERDRPDATPEVPVPPARAVRPLLAVVAVAVATLVVLGVGPRLDGPVVALKIDGLEVSRTYARLSERLGYPTTPPEFVLLRSESDANLAARVDALAARLIRDGDRVSTPLTTSLIARRIAQRDRLDLPRRAADLAVALRDAGFDPARFDAALADLRAPATTPPALATVKREPFARDADTWVASLRVDAPRPDLRARVTTIEPDAAFAGVGAIERSLKGALASDLARVLPLSAATVLVSLAIALRRARTVAVALAAAAVSFGLTWTTLGALDVPLHVFDALVIPVLFGLTLDETLFLHAARERGFMARELPRVATTALTTAAGFGALLICRFPGLRDVGWVGLVGSIAGLVGSVLVVAALTPKPRQQI